MADIPAAADAQILSAIRGALADVRALRNSTNMQTGYIGFDMVESTLAACHEAISSERDQALVVKYLKTAVGAVTVYGGGDVGPAVGRTRKTFETIVKELEPKDTGAP